MNIEKLVLDNISTLVIEPSIDESDNIYFKINITNINNDKKNMNYIDIYIKYLSKKYNSNIEQINSHIISKLLYIYDIIETNETTVDNNDIDISVLEINLKDNKSIKIYIPTSYEYEDEEFMTMINEIKKEINYEKLKLDLLKLIESNIVKIYNNNIIDNLYVYNSKTRTSSILFNEKISKKNSLYCFTKNLNATNEKDTIVKVTKDFLLKNISTIDKYKIENNELKLSFKNGKSFETSNEDLIKILEPTLSKIQDTLIDKKIKELKLNKHRTK